MLPLIIAHRGASAEAPENTLAAFRLAWKQGADAVEMDLRIAKDDNVVVAHDPDLYRVAGRKQRIVNLTSAQLRAIPAHWRDDTFNEADIGVPLLSEVLGEVPPDKSVFLECKAGREMLPALRQVLENGPLAPKQVTIIGFDLGVMAEAARQLPECAVAWILKPSLLGSLHVQIQVARIAGLSALDLRVDWALTAAGVAQAHNQGLKVFIWTVDDPARARELAAMGVDGLTTNTPALLRRALI